MCCTVAIVYLRVTLDKDVSSRKEKGEEVCSCKMKKIQTEKHTKITGNWEKQCMRKKA